ncbi:similar to An04g01890 [Aspergillus niger]|uniref:Similar to An04g01890 n=1 Tax=Aspergillus niger TaxID=5061 RepID=A0A100IA30_ASPNG|nr:similar to An04g01890 [Aspergillus niger]
MGRRAYLNRLALGRSPYEAPERPASSAVNPGNVTQRTVSGLHADGYVQHYDERGHPINPQSKSFGRELRRAKNDILSTMGIVVSEDGNVSGPSEQQKLDIIAAENDYGLVMATLDQVSIFLGSWWTSSLLGRVQTFKSYTRLPLLSIVRLERSAYGIWGFYFAGIPAWANLFPEDDVGSRLIRALLNVVYSAGRGTMLVLAIQTYMYSLLQSLHIVPAHSMPGIRFFLPFGELASMQLPNLPTDLSIESLSGFLLGLLKTPSLLVYLSPIYADELSVKVAYDNDLIDWMMPALGRRSEEENRRSNLSFTEDLMYELGFFRSWVLSWFGLKSLRTARASEQAADARRRREWLESLPQSIEQLQHERQSRTRRPRRRSSESPFTNGHIHHDPTRSDTPNRGSIDQTADLGAGFGGNQVLANEENRMSQSPTEMSSGDLAEMAPLRRAGTLPPPDDNSPALPNGESRRGDAGENNRNSRSNTLFSRPSSPATSSPASPRVRASLIHQNSDVITMQLELLGNRRPQNQGQATARPQNEASQFPSNGEVVDGQTISEFLDSLLSNQGRNLTTVVNSDNMDSDGLSNMTTSASPMPISDNLGSASPSNIQSLEPQRPPAEAPTSNPVNILPESIEEPSPGDTLHQSPEAERAHENDFDSEIFPRISDPNIRQNMVPSGTATANRVTILSSHPVDSLASHLASILTNVMFIPLESLYLRSLAASYLRSTHAPTALRADVRGLGDWSLTPRSDMLSYLGKIALITGIQAAVNATVWGVISGAAIKIGRRFCGWGTL